MFTFKDNKAFRFKKVRQKLIPSINHNIVFHENIQTIIIRVYSSFYR